MSEDFDHLIPDPKVADEIGVTTMSLWRWDRSPAKAALGWPPKIKIGLRNYRSRNGLEAFKRNLTAVALGTRASQGGAAS
jgi:hypothetical protein